MRIENPAMCEPRVFRLACQRHDSFRSHIALQRERKLQHAYSFTRSPYDSGRRSPKNCHTLRTSWKVTIVADVDSDIWELGLEDRVTEVAGFEIKLLPKPRRTVRDVVLPIFAEILAIGIDNRRGVVVNTLDFFFVNRNDHGHTMLLGDFSHELDGGPIGNLFDHPIPTGRLFGAEVR